MATAISCDEHEWELRGVSFDRGASGTQNYECRRCMAVLDMEQPSSVPRPAAPSHSWGEGGQTPRS